MEAFGRLVEQGKVRVLGGSISAAYFYASFVDSFTAVDELVIRQKKMTLARLMEAVNANFAGGTVVCYSMEGVGRLASIVGGYFDMGGLQIQVSAVDEDELLLLKKAKEVG